MKALIQMTNIEKGKLLADLFPGEIKGILNAIESYCKFIEDKHMVASNWDNPFVSLKQWYELADMVKNELDKSGTKLLSASRFANELFYGYKAFFTIDCIMKYAGKDHQGSKFWHMTQALFMFE